MSKLENRMCVQDPFLQIQSHILCTIVSALHQLGMPCPVLLYSCVCVCVCVCVLACPCVCVHTYVCVCFESRHHLRLYKQNVYDDTLFPGHTANSTSCC